jgi:hypothetical protein
MRAIRRKLLFLVLAPAVIAVGCAVEPPNAPDGGGSVTVVVVDSSGIFPGSAPGVPFAVDSTNVSLKSKSHEFVLQGITSADGKVSFAPLVTGTYTLFAHRELMLENNEKTFTGGYDVSITGQDAVDDSVFVNLIAASDLMINEIFYCGSDRTKFYFYDQYVELYNASADTMYLDGMILTRQLQRSYPDQDEVDYVRAIYAFQFPGTPVTGRQYPIVPGQFVVVAADAVDHSQYADNSIDLSNADWEFFNPLGNDYDNLSVPNITSIHPNSRIDFLINLSHGGVVLATGEEWSVYVREEGTDLILLPIDTVVDGVEYASNSSLTKELTKRVDAGFAGLGCTKYSGQSTERRELGLDTNDSSFDFVLIPGPTPGYSHAD